MVTPTPPPDQSVGARWARDGALAKVWPGLFFLAAAFAFHLPPVLAGQWPIEDDTRVFFFPLMVAIHDALRAGQFPQWTPLIFSGYPLFADGEGGVLYPLNLLVLPWLAPEVALVLLAVVHSSLAGLFTYGLVRVLGVGRTGALVSGLVYAYCGFAAGQMVHMDVTRAMVWLPLELLLAERSIQTGGAHRYRWTVLTGAVFGIQALALHIQVTLLSALAVAALLVWSAIEKVLAKADWGAGVGRALSEMSWAVATAGLQTALIGLIGVGLGAVQLFPLAEMAGQNYRALGLPQKLAEVNSVWPGSLVTLLLPRLFDIDSRDFWGPWVKWETVLYVGLVPLMLAWVGIAARRARHRAFFVLLGVVSLLAAMGSQAPFPVWGLLHQLPFVQGLESPGRFSLLLSLAVAVVAGHGADLLWQSRPSHRLGVAVLGGGVALVVGAAITLHVASERLFAVASNGTKLAEAYLRLPGVPTSVDGSLLSSARVTALAGEAISLSNPTTAWQLGLAIGAMTAVAVALAGGRLRTAAPVLMIGLTFADLWQTGLAFHPWAPIGELRPSPPPVLASERDGLYRVLTLPTLRAKDGPTDPNRLLAAGIAEAGGYSSLEPDRHLSYLSTVMQGDDDLLDLWNARYVMRRREDKRLSNYKQVVFDADEAVFLGKKGDSGRTIAFGSAAPPARARALALVAELRDARELVDGEEVSQVVVRGVDGAEQRLVLRAGDDVSDARADRPGEPAANHRRGEVAHDQTWVDPDGSQHRQSLFFSERPLPEPMTIASVAIQQTARTGRLLVYGIAALGGETGQATQLRQRTDRPQVYANDQIVVNGNQRALPRAFLVHESLVVPSANEALAYMHEGPFDPRQQVVLEASDVGAAATRYLTLPRQGGGDTERPSPALRERAGVGGNTGDAAIERYSEDQVMVRVRATQPAFLVLTDIFYPGWVARVDGEPVAVLRANYLFRAVAVPASEHTVVFSYEPKPLAFGAGLTLFTAVAVLVILLGPSATRIRIYSIPLQLIASKKRSMLERVSAKLSPPNFSR